MSYDDLTFKIPNEAADYEASSDYVINSIDSIMHNAIDSKNNKIVINTNLRLGLPMENINKIAGPFVEAWAYETFNRVLDDTDNEFLLINVEAKERLNQADILLQFQKQTNNNLGITADIDVKATSADIPSSGKGPNITSFARIRTAYIEDPDYIFIILSIKHKVYSSKNPNTALMDGIMEIVSYNAYDIKYVSAADLNYNPALGTGQLQIKDINYVTICKRTAWEFCQLLDKKYMASSKHNFEDWLELAKKHGWIKDE
jgi:hypothetical protein